MIIKGTIGNVNFWIDANAVKGQAENPGFPLFKLRVTLTPHLSPLPLWGEETNQRDLLAKNAVVQRLKTFG
jgi:hypothetical protein